MTPFAPIIPRIMVGGGTAFDLLSTAHANSNALRAQAKIKIRNGEERAMVIDRITDAEKVVTTNLKLGGISENMNFPADAQSSFNLAAEQAEELHRSLLSFFEPMAL